MAPSYRVIDWRLTSGVTGQIRFEAVNPEFINVLAYSCMFGVTMSFPEILGGMEVRLLEVNVQRQRGLEFTTLGTSRQYLPSSGYLEAVVEFEEASGPGAR